MALMEGKMWIVAIGDPFNGLTLFGPFGDYDGALTWAEDNTMSDTEWFTVRVQDPKCNDIKQAV
jgi:hypothetical protein